MVSSIDGTISLHDTQEKKVIAKFDVGEKVSAIELHPDGLVLGVGLTNGTIKIYDIRDMTLQAEVPSTEENRDIPVGQIRFSNKGIFMAVSWQGMKTCRIYSLHKNMEFTEIELGDSPITSLDFDKFGGFLLITS